MDEDNLLDQFNIKTKKVIKAVEVKNDGVYVDLTSIGKTSFAQLGINSVIKFGKYRNIPVRDVLARDPEYLNWLSKKYRMTKELLDAINGD